MLTVSSLALSISLVLSADATFAIYGASSLPTIYVTDAEGKVTYQDIRLPAIEQALTTLLGEK